MVKWAGLVVIYLTTRGGLPAVTPSTINPTAERALHAAFNASKHRCCLYKVSQRYFSESVLFLSVWKSLPKAWRLLFLCTRSPRSTNSQMTLKKKVSAKQGLFDSLHAIRVNFFVRLSVKMLRNAKNGWIICTSRRSRIRTYGKFIFEPVLLMSWISLTSLTLSLWSMSV